MVDTSTLQQLENALMAYHEDQETLQPVVALSEQLCGQNWTSDLSSTLATAWADHPNRQTLLDKAENAVHYYGALAAWDEAMSYLSGTASYTQDSLSERLPVLEYWLGLFGEEGTNLLNQLKERLRQVEEAPKTEDAPQISDNGPVSQPQTEETNETAQVIEVVHPATAPSSEDVVMKTADVPDPVALDTELSEDSILESAEKIRNKNNTQQTTDTKSAETVKPIENNDLQEQTDEVVPLENVDLVEDDTLDSSEAVQKTSKEEKVMSQQTVENTEGSESAGIPQASQEESLSVKKETTTEQVLDGVEAANQTNYDSPQVDKAIQELDQLHALCDQEDAGDTDKISKTSIDQKNMPEIVNAKDIQEKKKSVDTNEPSESRNWDIAVFLRLNKLYNEACNWLSAWCIHMDNADKTSYPYYGFIVDLMYDLKEKVRTILDNQLLDEIIEQDVSGGRETLEKIESALDDEIAGLPDDFKQSTAEKIKLSAQEILGKIDTSTEKEDIGAPPDGFELIDDPYAVSTEQIISDFEKTEKEAQNQVDKLDVVDKNVYNTEKKGHENEKNN